MTLTPTLDDKEVQALKDTLDDEYKARETYEQVIHDFGEVRPFINIVEAEARHASALLNLFEKYGISPPPNRCAGKAPHFLSIYEACGTCIQNEIENVEIYDRALKSSRRPGIFTIYQVLGSTSKDLHLPAFQRFEQSSRRGGL